MNSWYFVGILVGSLLWSLGSLTLMGTAFWWSFTTIILVHLLDYCYNYLSWFWSSRLHLWFSLDIFLVFQSYRSFGCYTRIFCSLWATASWVILCNFGKGYWRLWFIGHFWFTAYHSSLVVALWPFIFIAHSRGVPWFFSGPHCKPLNKFAQFAGNTVEPVPVGAQSLVFLTKGLVRYLSALSKFTVLAIF